MQGSSPPRTTILDVPAEVITPSPIPLHPILSSKDHQTNHLAYMARRAPLIQDMARMYVQFCGRNNLVVNDPLSLKIYKEQAPPEFMEKRADCVRDIARLNTDLPPGLTSPPEQKPAFQQGAKAAISGTEMREVNFAQLSRVFDHLGGLEIMRPIRVLDLGCGECNFLMRALGHQSAKRWSIDYTGIDMAISKRKFDVGEPSINERLASRKDQFHDIVTLMEGDYNSQLDQVAGKYDIIVLNNSAQYSASKIDSLTTRLKSILSTEGIITGICMSSAYLTHPSPAVLSGLEFSHLEPGVVSVTITKSSDEPPKTYVEPVLPIESLRFNDYWVYPAYVYSLRWNSYRPKDEFVRAWVVFEYTPIKIQFDPISITREHDTTEPYQTDVFKFCAPISPVYVNYLGQFGEPSIVSLKSDGIPTSVYLSGETLTCTHKKYTTEVYRMNRPTNEAVFSADRFLGNDGNFFYVVNEVYKFIDDSGVEFDVSDDHVVCELFDQLREKFPDNFHFKRWVPMESWKTLLPPEFPADGLVHRFGFSPFKKGRLIPPGSLYSKPLQIFDAFVQSGRVQSAAPDSRAIKLPVPDGVYEMHYGPREAYILKRRMDKTASMSNSKRELSSIMKAPSCQALIYAATGEDVPGFHLYAILRYSHNYTLEDLSSSTMRTSEVSSSSARYTVHMGFDFIMTDGSMLDCPTLK